MTDTLDFIKEHACIIVVITIIAAIIGMIWYAIWTAPTMPPDYDEDYPLPPKYCDCKRQTISTYNMYKCANCGKLIDPEE